MSIESRGVEEPDPLPGDEACQYANDWDHLSFCLEQLRETQLDPKSWGIRGKDNKEIRHKLLSHNKRMVDGMKIEHARLVDACRQEQAISNPICLGCTAAGILEIPRIEDL